MSQNPFCQAVLVGEDTVICDRCGISWPVYEPFPPDCQYEQHDGDDIIAEQERNYVRGLGV
jgi:hypothetical protein